MNKKIIQAVENFVKKSFAHDATGHDIDHIDRVRKIALYIAKIERADPFTVEIAALLHDSADWKFAGEESGKAQVMEFLRGQNCDEEFIQKIIEIITHVSFKGAGVPTPMRTLEGKVVQAQIDLMRWEL